MATLPGLAVGLTLNSATFTAETRRVGAAVAQLGRQVNQQTGVINTGFSRVENQARQLRTTVAGLGAAFALREVVRATTDMERINNTFIVGTGSARGAAQAMAFVRAEALRLGLDLRDAAGQFAQLSAASRGTSLQGEETRQIFTAVAEAMTVLGRNSEQTRGALLALEQMISKGKISMEELRRQLGDRLPGAFQIAARSMDVTTSQLDAMVRKGELFADDFLPKFARQIREEFGGEALAKATQSLQASLNRLQTALFDFEAQVGKGGVAQAIGEFSRGLVNASQGANNAAQNFGAVLGDALRLAGSAALFAIEHIDELSAVLAGLIAFKASVFFLTVASAIYATVKAVLTLNAALLANPFTLIATAIGAAVAALVFYRDETVRIGTITATVGQIVGAVWIAVKQAVLDILAGIGKLAEALAALATLDFEGAVSAWQSAGEEFGQALNAPKVALQELREEVARAAISDEFRSGIRASSDFGDSLRQVADDGIVAAEEVEELGKKIQRLIVDVTAENSQLTRLNDAYQANSASIQDIQDAIEIENKLRSAGITILKAQALGILATMEANQELARSNKALEATIGVRDEAAQIQKQIDARGRETEELRIQLAIMKARAKFGEQYTTQLEREIVATEKLQSSLARVAAARDLGDTVEQQRLLLSFGGQETEEYRVQIRLLELKRDLGAEAAAGLEDQVRQLERQTTEIERAAEGQRLFTQAFETALENVQNLFTDTFESVLNGGITTFKDLAESVKAVFIRLAAEIATLMIFRPILQAGIPQALGGGLAGAGGGFGGLFSGAALGAANPAAGGVATGPGGLLVGGGATSSLGAPAAAGASWGGIFAAGALGALGGSVIAPLIFGGRGQSGIGGGIGGGVGAAAGFAFGGPLGALAGGALGSLGGGLLGSLFGGDGPGAANDTGALTFGTGRGSPFDPGVFGSLAIGGENTFAGPLRDIVQQFDQGVSEFLTGRQRELARQAVQSLAKFEGRFPESDPSKGFAEILKARSEAVLKAAFPDIRVGAVLEGAQGVEEIGRRTEVALKTIQTFNALTGETATPAAQLESALQAIRAQFAEIRPIARALGLDVGQLNAAMREQLKTAREQFVSIQQQERIQARTQALTRQAFVDQLRAFRPLSIDQALVLQLREIDRQFFALRQEARALGVSLSYVTAAHKAARRAAREQAEAAEEQLEAARRAAREQRLANLESRRDALIQQAVALRDQFANILDPLLAFQRELLTTGTSPAATFEELQRQFFRIQGQALSGDIGAIQQLPDLGRALIQAAEAFGASPLRTSTIETVQAAIDRVISRTSETRDEAFAGLGNIIAQADRNNIATLREEGQETRRVLNRIERQLDRLADSGRRVA